MFRQERINLSKGASLMIKKEKYHLIVIGASYGGIDALKILLPALSESISIPMVVVQHMQADSSKLFVNHMARLCSQAVIDVMDNMRIERNHIYIAPADYHLLIEDNNLFSISKDIPVSYSRPSIDVLFESAAEIYEESLIGVLLTGANYDGANGIAVIKEHGGLTIVQDPKTALMDSMPQSAINTGKVDHILDLKGIVALIADLCRDLGEMK